MRHSIPNKTIKPDHNFKDDDSSESNANNIYHYNLWFDESTIIDFYHKGYREGVVVFGYYQSNLLGGYSFGEIKINVKFTSSGKIINNQNFLYDEDEEIYFKSEKNNDYVETNSTFFITFEEFKIKWLDLKGTR